MQAVRERQSFLSQGAVPEELPPAPTAFPVELLHELQQPAERTPQLDSHLDLAAIHTSCLNALSFLLHSADDTLPSSSRSRTTNPAWASEEDRQLAGALKELLEVCNELESLPFTPEGFSPSQTGASQDYQQLVEQLSSLQTLISTTPAQASIDQSRRTPLSPDLHPTVVKVRESLNRSRLEALCKVVSRICDERSKRVASSTAADDPPVYRQSLELQVNVNHSRQESESLPDYMDEREQPDSVVKEKGQKSLAAEKGPATVFMSNEKMLMELDAVTSAIDRLFVVAPQLANQRAVLRASRIHSNGVGESSSSGAKLHYSPEEERAKERELMEIWERIEKAHGSAALANQDQMVDRPRSVQERRETFMADLTDRSDVGRMHSHDSEHIDIAIAKARELKRRDVFLRDLLEQTGDGRMASQDVEPPQKLSGAELKELEERRRQATLQDIVNYSSAGRISTQEHPFSPEELKANRRDHLMSSLAAYGSKGRLQWQDSVPRTPPTLSRELEEDTLEVLTSPVGTKENASVENDLLRTSSIPSRKTASASLRKVASFVRRGSVSKAMAVELDVQSLSYVAEHQENLQVIQVLLSTQVPVDWTAYTVETEVSSAAGPIGEPLAILKSSSGNVLRLDLPAPVTPWQKIELKDMALPNEFKLSAGLKSATPTSGLNMVITHALSAPGLRKMQPTALACNACDRELADVSVVSSAGQWERGAGFKDLPSEHWAEMLEAWMCHADAGFTNQLTERTKDGFWPIPGTVLVGGSYLLVDEADSLRHNLKFGSETSDMWRTVTCLCGEVVGRRKSAIKSTANSTIRFAKHSVGVVRVGADGEEIQSLRFPLSVFIVSDMLELAQAHASYRFSLTREDDDDYRLLIWLFNPSIGVSYRKAAMTSTASPSATPSRSSFGFTGRAPSSKSRRSSVASSLHSSFSQSETKSMKAVKVLYRIVSASELESNAHIGDAIMAGFKSGHSTEHLVYPRAVCDELESTLRHSTSVYPITRRQMGAFSIGFLERV